jgi:hypothetical protein
MSITTAQHIVDQVYTELGVDLAAYQNHDLQWLKDQLETFLELDVETEELSPAAELEETLLDDEEEIEE